MREEQLLSRAELGASAATLGYRDFFAFVLPRCKPYWRRALEVQLLLPLELACELALPLSAKYLFDSILPHGEQRQFMALLLILVVVTLANPLITARRAYSNAWVGYRLHNDMHEQLFEHFQHLPHSFYARSRVTSLVSRLISSLRTISQAFQHITGDGEYEICSALAAMITMAVLNPLLAGFVFAVIPCSIAVDFALGSRLQRASFDVQEESSDIAAFAQEHLAAYAAVKAYRIERQVLAAYQTYLSSFFRLALRETVLAAANKGGIRLVTALGELTVFGAGGYLVMQHLVSLGTLVAFVALLPSLVRPVQALAVVGQNLRGAIPALAKVTALLAEPITIADGPGAEPLPRLSHDITLEGLSAGYEADLPILKALSVRIAAGTHVAVVGPTGSGKSTLANLLPRFWDPQSGRILFDGRDLRQGTLDSLRGQIGLVFQDTMVFEATVRENIAIARPAVSESEIRAAAEKSGLARWVDALPAGFDTLLGERGTHLSGGQRRLLSITRALLADPPLVILDEPTAGMDARTEQEILETLADFVRGRTVITITHRLNLAALADRVLVLNQGKLVQDGTHTALVQSDGLYRRLFEEQMRLPKDEVGVEEASLRSIPLFADLDGGTLAALAGRLKRQWFPPGEELMREGEPGDAFYILNRGQTEVCVRRGEGEERVEVSGEGNYVGETALIREAPRNATVRAIELVEAFVLSRDDFLQLVQQVPAIRHAVDQTIRQRDRNLLAVTPRDT